MKQIVSSKKEKAGTKAKIEVKKARRKKKAKNKGGRPKGRKTRDKTEVKLSPELKRIKRMVNDITGIIGRTLQVRHLVMDGEFGNNYAFQMARRCGLEQISKLRCDSALYFRAEVSFIFSYGTGLGELG